MDSYLIYTDSSADIPVKYYEKYDIRIVPMDFTINGENFTFHTESPDHDKICDHVYDEMRKGADVHTAQITPFRYIETWEPELKAGNDILYLCFSSGMSATYDNARSAADQLLEDYPERRIEVVDSFGATGGIGLETVTSCELREQGLSLSENAAWLREHNSPNMSHQFTVGDLDYLHKGGRVSYAVALIGGMLNIKPLLVIAPNGKLEMVGKARGTKAALHALIKSTLPGLDAVPGVKKRIFITHTSKYEDAANLAEMIREKVGDDYEIETMCETPIIGVHTGPEFFAVFSWNANRICKQ